MNKPFKIKRNDYKNIYYSSDFHYSHRRNFIFEPRGFSSVEDYNKWLIDQVSNLDKDDLLINLGDLSLNSNKEDTRYLLDNIACQMFYLDGNHEGEPSKIYKQALKNSGFAGYEHASVYPLSTYPLKSCEEFRGEFGIKRDSKLVFFGEKAVFNIGNTFFHCGHFAPLVWDKMKYDNQVACCGHSHSNCKQINPDYLLSKVLDVGVDNAIRYNGTPFFKVEEVVDIMKKKAIVIHDHHSDI